MFFSLFSRKIVTFAIDFQIHEKRVDFGAKKHEKSTRKDGKLNINNIKIDL